MNSLGSQLDPIPAGACNGFGQTTGYVQSYPYSSPVGWTCQYCGQWVNPGQWHYCGPSATALQYEVINAKLDRIIVTLEQILHRLHGLERENLRVVPAPQCWQEENTYKQIPVQQPELYPVVPPLPPQVICGEQTADKQIAWGSMQVDAGK